jgi:hypothetical protein
MIMTYLGSLCVYTFAYIYLYTYTYVCTYNLGEILGKSNIDDNDWHSDDEDGHGGLDKEVVNSLHFGGFEPTKGKGANIYGPGK